ncbi:hypothetical protein EJ03DRAFT_134090 [Teratosphaeria nubilosa]|uniref:Secreted protein n=1 Tax=Teratosphaeria nubilosa TaxID=161662 RepID=A0A6G1L5P0_9PEZI|nr:hypothetical protein EJ03DRAFT_134090 [Teratosphaeria nubilosa]
MFLQVHRIAPGLLICSLFSMILLGSAFHARDGARPRHYRTIAIMQTKCLLVMPQRIYSCREPCSSTPSRLFARHIELPSPHLPYPTTNSHHFLCRCAFDSICNLRVRH